MATQVQTTSGERFDVTPDRFPGGCGDVGVEFDGGVIPWAEVDGFWTWSKSFGRWFYCPTN
jgi:hypothetical protein